MNRSFLAAIALLLGIALCLAGTTSLAGETAAARKAWPTDLPAGVPEWKNSEVVNKRSGTTEYIIIVKADRKSYDAYLAALKDAGYAVGGGGDKEASAKKAGIDIDISPHGEGRYQFWAMFAKAGAWPAAEKLPPFMQPLAGKPLVGEPYLNSDGDYTELSFVYGNITKDEAIAYLKSLAAKLTTGTYYDYGNVDGFASIGEGKFSWAGKTWHFAGELTEDAPGAFRFDLAWQEE